MATVEGVPDVESDLAFTTVVTLTPEGAETGITILDVTMTPEDSGVTVTHEGSSLTISGSYFDQFVHNIKWSETQDANNSKPANHEDPSWANIPVLGDPEFDFLIGYYPPEEMTRNVQFQVTYESVLSAGGGGIPPAPTESTLEFQQTVTYGIKPNMEQFKLRV